MQAGDRERERQPGGGAAPAAHEQHARADGEDARRLRGVDRRREQRDGDDERDHRRRAARDRVTVVRLAPA